jgi:phosphate transport system permease protein
MPERMYIEKTAAGIIVLLSVLISLNTLAIYLRKKFEVKW